MFQFCCFSWILILILHFLAKVATQSSGNQDVHIAFYKVKMHATPYFNYFYLPRKFTAVFVINFINSTNYKEALIAPYTYCELYGAIRQW